MNLPNDLIKSTDLEQAKDRIIHEFKCVNDKIIQSYALGGEHELTTQEIVDCLNGLATIDCDLQTAYAYIKGQEKQIEEKDDTIKALIQDSAAGKDLLKKQLAEQPKIIVKKIKEKMVDGTTCQISQTGDICIYLESINNILDNLLKEYSNEQEKNI